MRKVWTEKSEACRNKRKNYNREFKAKPIEAKTTKLCFERSTKRDNSKEERPWLVNKKLWENFKLWLEKEKSLRDFLKTTNKKNNKTKITLEEWNMKSLKNKKNSLV